MKFPIVRVKKKLFAVGEHIRLNERALDICRNKVQYMFQKQTL